MRKRSSYRPKGVRLDVMGYVMQSITPVTSHGSVVLDLRLKNHAALATLTQGQATHADVDVLVAALNVMEVLKRHGFGVEYKDLVREGLNALRDVKARGAESGRFVLKAPEMAALNLAMELHDAQLDAITIRDLEKALLVVYSELGGKKSGQSLTKEKNEH